MTILLADDEKLVRFTLKSMLKEIGIPSSSIQIACDGQEMVEKVASIRPDLALVDIKMPRLNGLEAIQKGRLLSPHTKWVILTSYSTFEYAKQAVTLGASAYLLKPVSPQELSQTVRRVSQAKRGAYQRLNDEFEAHLNSLLHDTTSIAHDTLDFIGEAYFWGSLLFFDSNLDKNQLLLQEQRACELIRKKQVAVIDQTTRIALCRLAGAQLALIGAWSSGRGERKSQEAIRDLFRKIQIAVNTLLPDSVCCTMIVGRCLDNFQEFNEHLDLLCEMAPLRAILGIGGSIQWRSIEERLGNRGQCELSRHLAGLTLAVRNGASLDFLKLADASAVTWKTLPDYIRREIYDRILRFLEIVLGFRPADPLHVDAWPEQLRQHSTRLFEHPPEGKSRDIIDQIMTFVEKNYMTDIGVAQIANDLGLTPNYLSQRFHKKTGTTFVKYLSRLRMAKARELLTDPSNRVSEVARQVGYGSARHFCALFKRDQGLTPSQYRKDLERRSDSLKQ